MTSIFVLYKILSSCLEIIEHILFVPQHPSFMPFLTIFSENKTPQVLVADFSDYSHSFLIYSDWLFDSSDWCERKYALLHVKILSTLVISKSKGPSKTVRDIRTSTYQICNIEDKTI